MAARSRDKITKSSENSSHMGAPVQVGAQVNPPGTGEHDVMGGGGWVDSPIMRGSPRKPSGGGQHGVMGGGGWVDGPIEPE